MKWSLLLAFSLTIVAGCKKDTVSADDPKSHASSDVTGKNNLTGTWRVFEFFQDQGDGTGHFVAATIIDEITFTASGELKYSANSPLAGRGFDRYKIIDGNHVQLYSSSSDKSDIYYYNRETDVYLLFNPQCRENCSRRYKLVD